MSNRSCISQDSQNAKASTGSSTVAGPSQSSQVATQDEEDRKLEHTRRARSSKLERLKTWWNPWRVTDGRYDGFKTFDLESFPEGYPRFAAVMDSDINTRDRIVEISEKLNNLDKIDEASDPVRLKCRRYDEELGDESQRSQVLQSLEDSLKEYDALLLREHAIVSLPRPTTRNHRTIFDWVYNNKPVVREEYEYLYEQRDCLLLGDQHDDWFRSFQERIWNLSHNGLLKGFLSSNSQTSDSHSTYSSNAKANLLIKIILALATTTMLMLPVVLLYVVKSSTGVKIAILLLFVLAFSMAILMMKNAKRHEAFAATAAYAAVLVVFLANLPTASVH